MDTPSDKPSDTPKDKPSGAAGGEPGNGPGGAPANGPGNRSGGRRAGAQADPPFDQVLQRLEAENSKALAMGGALRLAKRKAHGVLNARERIDRLFDTDSFLELGRFAASHRPELADRTPGDGKLSGFGRIDGRPAMVVANDMSVLGASSSVTNMRKIAHVKTLATQRGLPIVFLGESSGARVPDTMGARGMSAAGQDPTQYTRYRETPWASAVLGPCYGSSVWYACLSDFVVMRKGAVMAVSSPRVTGMAIGQNTDPEELGGWRMHADTTGMVDQIADTDEDAIVAIKQFLSYLPSSNTQPPPMADPVAPGADGDSLLDLVPTDRSRVYDMRKVIAGLADADSVLALKPRFGKSAVTCLVRLDGRSVGIVATNPMQKGGALDPHACEKVTNFIVLCDSFNIPLVFLVDTPGFLIGVEGERQKAPGKIMNFMQAVQMASVPKVSLILRKSYGQAYLNLGGGRNSDIVGVWPTAEVSFMDPAIGVRVALGEDVADDPARLEQAQTEMRQDASAYALAKLYTAHDIVDPRATRQWLVDALGYLGGVDGTVSSHRMAGWPTTY